MARHDFGPFGRLSAAGFVILSLLCVVDLWAIAEWPVSLSVTAAGAILLWYGTDPTASGDAYGATETR